MWFIFVFRWLVSHLGFVIITERERESLRELAVCSCCQVIVCVSSLWCHGLVCGLYIQNTPAFYLWCVFLSHSLYNYKYLELTLKAPITTNVISFSHLLKCLRNLFDKQCRPRPEQSYLDPRCLLLYLNLSVMLGNYLQQTSLV